MPGAITPPTGAIGVHHVEGGGGAEIDHHQRPDIALMRRQGVQQTVGADLRRAVHQDLEAPVQGGAGDQRLDAEPVAAEAAQVVERRRDDGADDGAADLRGLQPSTFDQRQEPGGIFIRGALRIGADTPPAAPLAAVMDGEDDVGVAGIDDEKHGRSAPAGEP
jgi:hypothetical protein